MDPGLLTSNSFEWETPQDLFEKLNAEFCFNIDVCANASNSKCRNYYTPEINGLEQIWTGSCWMNPPYGRQIKKWIKKAYLSAKKGATVVCLIPARTDTNWWHDYVMKGEIRFLKGRLYFRRGDKTGRAPFPSAVVIFKPSGQMELPFVKNERPNMISKPGNRSTS